MKTKIIFAVTLLGLIVFLGCNNKIIPGKTNVNIPSAEQPFSVFRVNYYHDILTPEKFIEVFNTLAFFNREPIVFDTLIQKVEVRRISDNQNATFKFEKRPSKTIEPYSLLEGVSVISFDSEGYPAVIKGYFDSKETICVFVLTELYGLRLSSAQTTVSDSLGNQYKVTLDMSKQPQVLLYEKQVTNPNVSNSFQKTTTTTTISSKKEIEEKEKK